MTDVLKIACRAGLLALALALGGTASGQDSSHKPITIVVPFAPGGLTDSVARLVGVRLSDRRAQPVLIDNRPGSGGLLGMKAPAKPPADGHSLVIVFPSPAAVSPILNDPPPPGRP